ncbi:PepSY-associated TM helix domain protein [Desulfofarcimen acetoxidans DSM 771]|uniref:PepSY-associated TM helix domain protein n=1 Tax=Desulfofarcimen acetoxidans (strain ATCC 49208 / DSM 771 / KCTC 5769 / VKM B-1644 / 5575) TaxID=485916 RepID=C8W2F8_DESAS|nr:PepSY domain-containing protein [Desulfofarcimen acetoxidans]ACV63642.1 PepSY-associated TM helix domain protein [Desulfofarcimen acetoxidans DSM 771]
MIKSRQLHLWIGLITSVFILIEAVTGLIMLEPWLIGVNHNTSRTEVEMSKSGLPTTAGESDNRAHFDGKAPGGADYKNPGNSFSLMGLIKGLHSGRIGNTDISVFLDAVAISLIILSTTGIILSVQILSVKRRIRGKK